MFFFVLDLPKKQVAADTGEGSSAPQVMRVQPSVATAPQVVCPETIDPSAWHPF